MSWMSIEFITDALDGDRDIDFDNDFDEFDLDGDGTLDAVKDCPFQFGSPEAKLWWKNIVEPYAKSQVTEDMTGEYGDKVVGAYKGKALVPGMKGSANQPQGDFDFMKDKIRVTKGLSELSARKIAAKVMWGRFR